MMQRIISSKLCYHHYGNLNLILISSGFLQCDEKFYSFIRRASSNVRAHLMEPPWRIMFFGSASDDFAFEHLRNLCSKFRTGTLISKLDVITTKILDENNNKNSVYQYARSEHLNTYSWPISLPTVKNEYDVGVLVSFGHLIPVEVIELFPLGILNVHPSLLPRWRGAAPVVHAILNGDSVTGVTIMKISPFKFDTGDIVKQYSIAIKSHETTTELTKRLAVVGSQLLMECVRNLPRSALETTPQSNEGVTYAKKVTKSMALVNWENESAYELYNRHRALSHVFLLKTYWFNSSVKLLDVSIDQLTQFNPENQKNMQKFQVTEKIFPGLIEFSSRRSLLRIQCKDGKWICVCEVMIGGKTLSPREFYNGYLSKIGNSLERRFTSIENQRNY